MKEDKIKWCCKQKRGIELTDFKPHLSESYMKESEEDYDELPSAGKKWKPIIAYYSCYEAFYSILMKCGIKCEIHECTLELINLFDFGEGYIDIINDLKNARQGNQYYLKRNPLENKKKVREFIDKCKEILRDLNSKDIEELRNKIKKLCEK